METFDTEPRSQPPDPDLDFASGDLSDDDPDIVAGMKRLEELRKLEGGVPEVRP